MANKFSLAGTPNAAQSRLTLNEKVTTQGAYETAVGCDTSGVHIQTGAYLSEDAKKAWKDYVDGIYTSVLNVTSVTLNWDAEDLAKYLVITYWADVALAEARRDITMLNMSDALLVSAQVDFFGPGYPTLARTRDSNVSIEQKKVMVDRYNSAARMMSSSFPHPSFPMKDIHTYLVGNVFCDDRTDRTNYIYFHCMNRSLRGDSPSAVQALDAFDAIMQYVENDVAFRPISQSIKSNFLKLYGDAAIYHPMYLNEDDKPRLVYDADVLGALTNAEYAPYFLLPPPDMADYDLEWAAAEGNATSMVNKDAQVLYENGPILQYFTRQHLGTGTTIKMPDNLQHQLNFNPRLYTAPSGAFSGEAVAKNLLFSQMFACIIDESGSTIGIGVVPVSHSGITIATMWSNAMSQEEYGTWMRYWLVMHAAIIADGTMITRSSVPAIQAAAARTISQCKFGRTKITNVGAKAALINPDNVIGPHNFAFTSSGTSYVPTGDIDEYAIYTDVAALMHNQAAAYFTIGTQVYRPVSDTKAVMNLAPIKDSGTSKRNDKGSHSGKGGKF